ncbi:HAUS augmin-like complex subunit 7 isoform X2 [Dendronephthya gigantea]|uniref:HAUS augmin-like complex subunit 7 isoform X2 n=1 Tax=Dendronephthya gigantea TaxID=151771 RepID=UPI00106A42CB|nr:HAUS augmin-like complex subunit 7 isoform X2 [Dendronephthya gigantea]
MANCKILGCPHVENVEESWMSELLFKPGEPRLRLLQWLLARFDQHLEEILDSHQAVVSSLTDSRVGKLLFCANLLGLCREDDVDLITGASPKSKQLQFYEDITDMLLVVEDLDTIFLQSVSSTPERITTRPGTIVDAVSDACGYLDLLCRQEDLGELFKEKIHLYPPDIEKQLEIDDHDSKRSKIPDTADITSLADQIETELKKQKKLLEKLKSESSTEHDPQTVNKVSKTLSLTMSTLTQMIEGFNHCYETEMKQWSGREKPILSELGPVFKRVDILVQKLLQILTSLEKLKMSHLQITHVQTSDMENYTVPLGKLAFNSLQECVGVLDEAVKRKSDMLNDSEF